LDPSQCLLSDGMSGWSPKMDRSMFFGYVTATGSRFRDFKPERYIAVWSRIQLWICIAGFETRHDYNLGIMQGMPLGPDSALHSRMMHFAIAILERIGMFSTDSGDAARWAVYIDDGAGGVQLRSAKVNTEMFSVHFCGCMKNQIKPIKSHSQPLKPIEISTFSLKTSLP